MPARAPQNLKNHARLDPTFHFFVAPIALINFFTAVWRLVNDVTVAQGWNVALAAALVVALFKIRIYALRNQDRIIRLEERLRLAAVLPESLRGRIPELNEDQLIGLRFASDEELPELVENALANAWNRDAIKKHIGSWRPDYYRV
jgi:hypothetical protein